MLYSDDEDELIPPTDVADYKFVNGDDEPVSFADLPLKFNKRKILDGNSSQKVYLRGKTDKGLRSIYTEVIAWEFNLSFIDKPIISVLSVEGNWVKLSKPIRAFEGIIRTALVTVEFLHIVKWNRKISSKTGLWDCLCRRFSNFNTKPSKEDLLEHEALIREIVKRDKALASAYEITSTFLKEKPWKLRDLKEDIGPCKPSFVDEESADGEESDEESEGHVSLCVMHSDDGENEEDEDRDADADDYICSICDNGGDITQCEGKCKRSFHLIKNAGEGGEGDSCRSLGFTKDQVEQMKDVAFYCENCKYNQHQCFSCGKLGSSVESTIGYDKVFCCINRTCGRFYHPYCVAKLLHPNDEVAAKDQGLHISFGEHFTCPVHKCYVCKEYELRTDKQLQFAICRRCPRAYHRKCLPRNIAFEADVNKGRASVQRAWDDVIPNRILTYCLDHDIDDDLLTPIRNHLEFPHQKLLDNTNSLLEEISSKREEPIHEVSKSHNAGIIKTESSTVGDKILSGNLCQPNHGDRVGKETQIITSDRKNAAILDDGARKSILSLIKNAYASITLEEIKKGHEGEASSSHANSSKLSVDNITLGMVEVSVEATRAALEILDKGGYLQDAKAVCGEDLLLRLGKWKEKLRIYLAPFSYETRYISSGSRIINMDKMQEIVNMLHCYIQDGDMVVDFCCGSKDFSCLLKKKLIKEGKPCSIKNFDIVQSTDGFCFEKKDWMTVEPHELPDGSRMIMSLNPPLGVDVSLVNEFINKALTFKPKLLILIVPRKIQRLDKKESPYDLVWENDEILAEKSYHLPGSVDEHDKPIDDSKMKAQILYLWSNPDWTQKYNAIAELNGHPGSSRKNLTVEENLISHEEPKCIGENNGGPSNNRSERNLKDSANNKRKVDMDKKAAAKKPPNKRPALNRPLSKLGPSEAHQVKHLEQQSSHANGKDHSEYKGVSKNLSSKKGVSKNLSSKKAARQSRAQKRKNDSPTQVSELDSGKRSLTNLSTGYLSDVNPNDTRRKREVDMQGEAEMPFSKRPALNPPSPKLCPSYAHSPKHLKRQSSHVHSRKPGSDTYNDLPRLNDKGVSEDHRSKNLDKQSLVQKNYGSPTHVSKPDCSNMALSERCMAYPENSTSSLPVKLHVGMMGQSQRSEHLSSCLSQQVNPASSSAMQNYASCLSNLNNVQKTTRPVRPLDFTPVPYRPYHGTVGWLDE